MTLSWEKGRKPFGKGEIVEDGPKIEGFRLRSAWTARQIYPLIHL